MGKCITFHAYIKGDSPLFCSRSLLIPPKAAIPFATEHIPALGLFFYRFFLLGYRFLYLDRLEHMASCNRHFFTDQLLDIFQIRNLFHIAKGKSDPATAGTTGTADTVHLGFRYIRQIIVDDMRKMVDIDTAGGDIGRDQDTERMILKTG